MVQVKRIVAVMALLVAAHCAYAEIRPSFDVESCTWNATDIVVASEGKTIDGKLTILKALAGTLKAGDTINLAEFAKFRDAKHRTVWGFGRVDEKKPPLVVSGDKLILFLKRGEGHTAEKPSWKFASAWGDWSVSFAWIHQGKVYAFVQVINPGDCVLTKQRLSEDEFVEHILALVKTRNELLACRKLADTKQRAQVAASYIGSSIYTARAEALGLLSGCGKDALPHLREILKDQSKLHFHDRVIKVLGTAGGEAVVSELTAIVESELAFWKKTAPGLKSGWWNGKGLEWKRVRVLRERYSVALETLRTLETLKSPSCKKAVTDFRDYWRSMPQLEDKSGLNQMSQACDAVLKALPN